MHARSASATGSCAVWGCPNPLAWPLTWPFAIGWHVSTSFLRAVVSPVRLLSSISKSTADIKRTSAGILSPVVKVTISPGTNSLARVWTGFPSLSPLCQRFENEENGEVITVSDGSGEEQAYSELRDSSRIDALAQTQLNGDI